MRFIAVALVFVRQHRQRASEDRARRQLGDAPDARGGTEPAELDRRREVAEHQRRDARLQVRDQAGDGERQRAPQRLQQRRAPADCSAAGERRPPQRDGGRDLPDLGCDRNADERSDPAAVTQNPP
jgi:hypothetical protein